MAEGNPAQVQPNQDQLPEWIGMIPDENLRKQIWDKAKPGWLMEADYRKKTQDFAEERKKLEERAKEAEVWDQWWKEKYEPWAQKLKPFEQDLEALMQGQAKIVRQNTSSNTSNPNTNNGTDPFQDWDTLRPQEQFSRYVQLYNEQVFRPWIQEFNKNFASFLADKEKQYDRSFKLQTRALKALAKDSELDVDKWMEEAAKLAQGQYDPVDLAMERLNSPKEFQRRVEEEKKKIRDEIELEYKNKEQKPGAMGSTSIPVVVRKPTSRTEIEQAVRQKAINAGIPWVR